MEYLYFILENIIVFQIVLELIEVIVGAGLCFGPLKWQRGLITTVSIGWGCVLGLVVGYIGYESDIISGFETIFITAVLGAIIFPILTYTIAGLNRFILGYIVTSKLTTMLITVLAKEGMVELEESILMPIMIGLVAGLIFMAWTQMRVLPFVLACSFLGASEIAPTISEWYNRIMYSTTSDISYLFDPIDFIFALFKIELTDTITLISMILLMMLACYAHLNRLKKNNIPYNTPVISFEIDINNDNNND